MTDLNSPSTNRQSSLLVLVFTCLALVLLLTAYLVYARNNLNTNQVVNQQNQSNLTELNSVENTTTNQAEQETREEMTNSTNPTNNTSTRDLSRYYNDEDGYSFIVPDGLKAKPTAEVYPSNSSIDFSHMIAISSEFPESVKLGGSDWAPNARITVINEHPQRSEKTESVTINNYTYEYYSIYSEDFDVTEYVYLLKQQDREILISSFKKDIVNKLVNSFQLL